MLRRTRYMIVLVAMLTCYTGVVVVAHLANPQKVRGAAIPNNTYAQEAAANIEICLAMAEKPKAAEEPGSTFLTYEAAYKKARKLGKPLIIFVKQPMRAFDNCIMMRLEEFYGITEPAVVIGMPSKDPKDTRFDQIDLLGTPTDAQIKDVLSGKDAAKIDLTIPKSSAIIECTGGK